jgi:hypothetical protein
MTADAGQASLGFMDTLPSEESTLPPWRTRPGSLDTGVASLLAAVLSLPAHYILLKYRRCGSKG